MGAIWHKIANWKAALVGEVKLNLHKQFVNARAIYDRRSIFPHWTVVIWLNACQYFFNVRNLFKIAKHSDKYAFIICIMTCVAYLRQTLFNYFILGYRSSFVAINGIKLDDLVKWQACVSVENVCVLYVKLHLWIIGHDRKRWCRQDNDAMCQEASNLHQYSCYLRVHLTL